MNGQLSLPGVPVPNEEGDFNALSFAVPLIGNKEALEEIVGCAMPPSIFNYHPWGRRLVVVRDSAAEKSAGGIWIPDQSKELPTTGWVVSVGPQVGDYHPDLGGCPLSRASLIGAKVLFGMYAGDVLLTGDPTENEFESRFSILVDTSIWGTLSFPPEPVPLEA